MSDCKHETFLQHFGGGDAFCADCDMDLDSVRCEEIDKLRQELEAAKDKVAHYQNMTANSRGSLSERLQYWRACRPDEWVMDEFIREAKELEAIRSKPTPREVALSIQRELCVKSAHLHGQYQLAMKHVSEYLTAYAEEASK